MWKNKKLHTICSVIAASKGEKRRFVSLWVFFFFLCSRKFTHSFIHSFNSVLFYSVLFCCILFCFVLFFKMGFLHDGQAGLELLTSGDPPT